MRSPRQLWIVTLSCAPEAADALSDAIGEGAVALSILAPPRQPRATVEAIFDVEPDSAALTARVAVWSALSSLEAPPLTLRPAPSLDWLKKVAEDFPPLKVARWTVHGALHRAKVPNRLRALQIDATSAFGTGEHPTTQGCLIMLDALLKRGFRPRRMADIGCGSGILAMACVQAARGRAVGVDLDMDSVLVARGNARLSGLASALRFGYGRGYAAPSVARGAPYDLIMANIFARPLCAMAADLKAHLRPGGYAILSGLLTTQAKMVLAAHRMQGLALVRRMTLGEWTVLALRRGNGA